MTDIFFHLAFIAIFVAFMMVRAFYRQKATSSGGKAEFKEGKLHVVLRLAVGIPFMSAVLAYFARPRLLGWAGLPLPVWLQWIGVGAGLASVVLIWWVHRALDRNFSLRLHVREQHTLVTHGPYQWVRHPMYTVLYVFLVAIFLLTGNWFIGGVFIISLTLIVATRLANEEAAMTETFGDDYREYMQRTGRFLPRLTRL